MTNSALNFFCNLYEACSENKGITCRPREGNTVCYYGNTAVNLEPLPVTRALLTLVERQRRPKVPPNARCLPSYDFSTQKVNVQRRKD